MFVFPEVTQIHRLEGGGGGCIEKGGGGGGRRGRGKRLRNLCFLK